MEVSRRPAEVFPPGDMLKQALAYEGWSQTDLAEIIDRPVRLVNEIIAGKRAITAETARGLAAALHTSPEFWMALEASYQLWRDATGDNDPTSRRARLYKKVPLKEIIRRGWVDASN